ncbi:MAG TPA: haloacid dehalogenase type II [Nocardioidaceae bacterium]|nr:haloacid dehalogenase type II [Nocardioidaceae bacterium]
MSVAPSVVAFDVNETMSDMSPMASRFIDVGAPASMAQLWFASVLRDGFALSVAGSARSFSEIGEEALRVLLPPAQPNRTVDDAVAHIMAGFAELVVHPDIAPGVHQLQDAGLRLVTLSNGAASVAEKLVADAGIADRFEQLLSVEDVGVWKPDRRAYEYAARTCDVPLEEMLLVAVHPWDLDGAARAGMQTAWVNRSEAHYPAVFTPPTHTVASLEELADRLA